MMDITINIVWILLGIALIILGMLLLYILIMCVSSVRKKKRSGHQVTRRATISAVARADQHSRRVYPHSRASDNTYLMSPQQRLPAAHRAASSTLPSRILIRTSEASPQGQEVEFMRFYTPEELLNFPFEEHQRRLSDLLEEERRSSRRIETSSTHHHHHSIYIPMGPEATHEGSRYAGGTRGDVIQQRDNHVRRVTRDDRGRRCLSTPVMSPIYQMAPPFLRDTIIEEEPPSYDEALRLADKTAPEQIL